MLIIKRKGLSLLELIVCTVIIGILSTTALPLAQNLVRNKKEELLREHLKDMRKAIDRFYEKKTEKEPGLPDFEYYPKTLNELVENRFLRKIPLDPFTEKADWKTRSSTDAADAAISNQQNVFDIFSASEKSDGKGQPYSSW